MTDDGQPIHPRSYVKITGLRREEFAVATYDYVGGERSGIFKLTGRWYGKSEGQAMLVAQRYAAQGYRLIARDGGRP